MKWTSFWKHTSSQYWIRKKQTIWTDQTKLQDWTIPSITGKLYQTYKEEPISILSRLAQKIEENETLSNSVYLALGHPYSVIKNQIQYWKIGKENYRPISLIEIYARIINRILANQIQQYIKRIIYCDQWVLFKGWKDDSVFTNQSIQQTTLTKERIKKISWLAQ